MCPRKSTRRNTQIVETTPPLPPLIDTAALNDAIVAAVATAMAQCHSTGASGGGTPVHSTQGEILVHSREYSYKDFTNCKPKSFKGTGGVIALS